MKNYISEMAKSRSKLEDVIRYSNNTEAEVLNAERCRIRIEEIDAAMILIVQSISEIESKA